MATGVQQEGKHVEMLAAKVQNYVREFRVSVSCVGQSNEMTCNK